MRHSYTNEQLKEVLSSSLSYAEVLRKLSLKACGGNYKTLKLKIKALGADTSHFTGAGWNVGLRYKQINPPRPLNEILKKDSRVSTHKLRLRLIKEGFKKHQCECCNLETWLNMPISLELHHIDGDTMNNEISNLQLLCPNCHSLTENYRGRGKQVAQKETSGVEAIKFGEALTGNTEPSLETGRCRDLTVAI